jgi:hypothetical protein
MKHRPIHENLDTSFVNLSALVRYLRRRGFVGKIRVELSGYEADIFLSEPNQLRALEHDRIAGRIAEGEEALQRILIRSREPGGIISVYQEVEETEVAQKLSEVQPKIEAAAPPKPQLIQNIKPVSFQVPTASAAPTVQTVALEENPAPRRKLSLEHFQFELKNKVEDKAKQANLSAGEWQTLLDLTGEMLGAVDKILASAHLDFAAAFQKARAEVSADYPFLSPASNIFEYANGVITMSEQTSAKLFTSSILEILQRILEKLGANPKFADVYQMTTQKIIALAQNRKQFYDKFHITKPLEKIIGV